MDHDYVGHSYIGYAYIGQNYTGHNYIGDNCIGAFKPRDLSNLAWGLVTADAAAAQAGVCGQADGMVSGDRYGWNIP